MCPARANSFRLAGRGDLPDRQGQSRRPALCAFPRAGGGDRPFRAARLADPQIALGLAGHRLRTAFAGDLLSRRIPVLCRSFRHDRGLRRVLDASSRQRIRHRLNDCSRWPAHVVQEGRRTYVPDRVRRRRRMPTSREARHETVGWGSLAALLALLGARVGRASGQPVRSRPICLFGNNDLKHVAEAVKKDQRLTVAVVGTGSSIAGRPGRPTSAYPARLEAVLKRRLPAWRSRSSPWSAAAQTAEDMAKGMAKLLVDEKPDLVIWQTGTIDAIRRVEPDDFRAALDEGVETVQKCRRGRHLDEYAIQPADRYHDCARSLRRQHAGRRAAA